MTETKVVHLILVDTPERLGMDGFMKLIAEKLQGDVTHLVPVKQDYGKIRVKAGSTLRIRAEAGNTLSAILGTVTADSGVFSILKQQTVFGGVVWYQIKYNDKLGWVSGNYIDKVN